MLTQQRLKELLLFHPDTGKFTRLTRTTRNTIGDEPGGLDAEGYHRIRVDGTQYLTHRLVWLYVYNQDVRGIDHINGIKHDNRVENLRRASDEQNAQNRRKPQKNNSTRKLGVSRFKGKFRARIQSKGKVQYLGVFATSDEAHEAYLSAKRQAHQFCTI